MYEYKSGVKLNLSAFYDAVYNYCCAEQDYHTFCQQYKRVRYTGEYYANKDKYEGDYWRKYAESNSAYSALCFMCDLVGLDVLSVLRVFKAIRRNAQYQQKWEREAHFNNDRYFEFESKRTGSIESFCDLCKVK